MTTRTTKRRPGRRRKPGFIGEFRRATHTDRLRSRVGGAAGRALVRRINRHRAKRGKPPIPIVGDWFGGKAPKGRKPTGRPAGRGGGRVSSGGTSPSRPRRKADPAFAGPHVKATNKRRKAPLGGTSTSSAGIAGPGNRGAGAGMGAPAYGTGGAHGDDGHMISPGSYSGSAAPSRRPDRRPETDADRRFFDNREGGYRGPIDQDGNKSDGWPTNPLTGGPAITPGSALLAAAVEAGKGLLGIPDHTSTSTATPNGSTSMGNIDELSEPPTTDAEHLSNVNGLAEEIQKWADQLAEYVESCKAMGMDDDALRSADNCVESLGEAASAAGQMASDYESTYAGVRDTAAAGTSIPGSDGQPATFWNEVG
jgi:hypothetical protein